MQRSFNISLSSILSLLLLIFIGCSSPDDKKVDFLK